MKKDKIIKAIIDGDRRSLYELVTGKSAMPTWYALKGEGEAVLGIDDNDGDVKVIYNEDGRLWLEDGQETTLKEAKKFNPPLPFLGLYDSKEKLEEALKRAQSLLTKTTDQGAKHM